MSDNSFRAIPSQSRSQQTVDLILETAAALFVEQGYENTTTNVIAERAGISIGTLYRYFPDKVAVLNSLATQYYNQMGSLFDKLMVEDMKYLPPALFIDRLLDPILELHCSHRVYAHILLGSDVSTDIASVSCGSESEINAHIAEFFHLIAPQVAEDQARMAAIVCKASLKALIALLGGFDDPTYQQQVINEFKKMLLAYLKPIIWP